MTPRELSNFTSGLPDDPTNLPPNLERRSIQYYTVKRFLTWISGWAPDGTPPRPYLYSNAGIGLLGYLLMTATGKQWEEQLNVEILGQLGMESTALRLAGEKQRLAQGHHPNGSDAPSWPIFAWYPAGGLRSTARDMLSFGEANLGHTQVNGHSVSAEMIAAMKLAQKPMYTMPNPRNQQAMAWVVNSGEDPNTTHPEIVKDGGTVGFSTVILLNPFKDTSLFIGVNQSQSSPVPVGLEIGRHLP